MSDSGIEIRTIGDASEMASIVTVFQQVWGSVTPIVGVELLCAISHAGGYVAGVFDSDNIIGASFGFLARHSGEDALHSHVTGVLPGVQHSGIGRSIKNHQRDWAAARGIDWITWTFDPLVRRNAWFNIEVLGAHVAEYLVDFYGPMTDAINAHDESDRLLVAWRTDDRSSRPNPAGPTERFEVATPDDIVVLRRTDQPAAIDWRRTVRSRLAPMIAAGGTVTGFTRDGSYVVDVPI